MKEKKIHSKIYLYIHAFIVREHIELGIEHLEWFKLLSRISESLIQLDFVKKGEGKESSMVIVHVMGSLAEQDIIHCWVKSLMDFFKLWVLTPQSLESDLDGFPSFLFLFFISYYCFSLTSVKCILTLRYYCLKLPVFHSHSEFLMLSGWIHDWEEYALWYTTR